MCPAYPSSITDYSLRHRRDGNAGTTILYHLRIDRRPHSSSLTTGRRELLGMGTTTASAGAAGPSEGLRAGWSSGRTEAGVPRGERTRDYGRGPTTGTRSQTTCYVRRGTGRVVLLQRFIERFFLTIGQLIEHGTIDSNPLLLNAIFLRNCRYALICNT